MGTEGFGGLRGSDPGLAPGCGPGQSRSGIGSEAAARRLAPSTAPPLPRRPPGPATAAEGASAAHTEQGFSSHTDIYTVT